MGNELILDVPLLHQPKGSKHCAVASMRMLMAYSGELIEHGELIIKFPEIDKTQVGISPMTARSLVEAGYDVEFFTRQSSLFGEMKVERTEKDLKYIKEIARSSEKGSDKRRQLEHIIKFIEAGGKFSTGLLKVRDIDAYLTRGTPVRVIAKPSVLHSDPKYKLNHIIIIRGMRNDEYLINDPAPQFAEPYWVKKDKLLESWRAAGGVATIAVKK